MDFIVGLIIVACFYVLSFLLCQGKCSSLLGGVRSMKDEDKKIKVTKLCGKILIVLTTIILAILILDKVGIL